ncbi:MAG: glycosyltransferase family 2 protein, partial [Candidatus Hydrothermae bacterium]|nr:glycosyltransferase family 2 protein [Candidatus Hydrothermae bacterium]
MKISVLIPAYNEKENLEELLNHIHKFREKEDIDWEFIIIDDGSTDGSFELLKKLHGRYPYIKVIKHRRNFGLTEALLTGLHHSTGDALVFFPADLQFHLEDVMKMVAKMEEGYDLVAGKKKGKYEKKFVSSIYNLLSKKLFNINVSDMNSIKVMKREILELLPHRKGWHRYIIPLA